MDTLQTGTGEHPEPSVMYYNTFIHNKPMTDAAYKVWEAFKAELIVEPTDDMKEALATAIREVADQLYHDPDVDYLNRLSYNVEAL